MSIGNPGKSLNIHAPWHEVLQLLGINVQVLVLPATVSCPHCKQNSLHVYQDITSGGAWHYCSTCKFAGDTIELVASVWKQDIATTILKLNAHGISFPDDALDPSIIDRYILGHVEYRKGIQALWELSQERLPLNDTHTIAKLHDKFTAGHAASSITWPRRGKSFLGGCHINDVLRAFRHEKVRNSGPDLDPRTLNSGHDRIFKGRGWTDVLVLPHYELPGKIRGFTFIGREGSAKDILYRRVNNHPAGRRPKIETNAAAYDPGLTMYETMFSYHSRYKSTTFVLADPVVALRLQLRHLRQSNTPLPVCGSYSDGKLTNRWLWSTAFSRNFIFWGRTLTPDLIQQARHANGKIAVGKTLSTLAASPTEKSPTQWLDLMERTAKPWQVVLEDELKVASLPVAESLLLRLRLSSQELKEFSTGCSLDVREKLADLFATAGHGFKSVLVESKTLIETKEGWCLEDGTVICDTVIRIEKVVHQPVKNCAYYRGYVERNGNRVEFTDEAEYVELHIGKWLRNKLISAGLGRPKVSRTWQKHLLTIAQSFHEPENVVGIDSFGWKEEQQSFVFPHFVLRRNGEVVDDPLVRVVSDNSPAVALRRPQLLTPQQVTQLNEPGEHLDVFWATTACVVSNIISPAFNLPPTGIALFGAGATMAGRAAARTLGCVDVELGQQTMGSALRKLHTANTAHGWPFVLKKYGTVKNKTLRAWLADPEAKNCVVVAGWYQAQVLMLNGGWNVIECQRPGTTLHSVLELGPLVLPAFLQYLCRQRLQIQRDEGLVRGVLNELSLWFEGLGGHDLRRCGRLIHVGEVFSREPQPRAHFLNIVFQMMTEHKLRLVIEGFNNEGRANQAIQHNEHIYVPQQAVLELITKKGAPGLDINLLEQEFNTYSVNGALYWSIPEEEWLTAMNERRPSAITEVI
jgi:hypothetical protein